MRIPRRPTAVAALTLAVGLLAACGSSDGGDTASTHEAGDHYPVTIENCGAEVTFEEEPTSVILLKSAWVPYLSELGVLDHVTAKAGAYPDGYYADEVAQEVGDIETLTDRLDASGHLLISREAVVEREPDLVLGLVDNLGRDSLDEVGIPLLEVSGLCPEGAPDPSYEAMLTEMETVGRVFNREDEAKEAAADLRERVEDLSARGEKGEKRTAAVLYPTVGGGTTYAYGNGSMADPQLEAAGLSNVYGDVDERVFEVTLESLLEEDPDVLVLLHSEGEPAKVEAALTDLPGAERLSAVRDDEVLTQLLNFTDPPTPLTVDGLERIVERFGES